MQNSMFQQQQNQLFLIAFTKSTFIIYSQKFTFSSWIRVPVTEHQTFTLWSFTAVTTRVSSLFQATIVTRSFCDVTSSSSPPMLWRKPASLSPSLYTAQPCHDVVQAIRCIQQSEHCFCVLNNSGGNICLSPCLVTGQVKTHYPSLFCLHLPLLP